MHRDHINTGGEGMKVEGVLERIIASSTDSEPARYKLVVTGEGTITECTKMMDWLFRREGKNHADQIQSE